MKLSVNNEIICVCNKHHIIFRRKCPRGRMAVYRDRKSVHPWDIRYVFFGVGVEQIWLWENAAEKGKCFGPRNIS